MCFRLYCVFLLADCIVYAPVLQIISLSIYWTNGICYALELCLTVGHFMEMANKLLVSIIKYLGMTYPLKRYMQFGIKRYNYYAVRHQTL